MPLPGRGRSQNGIYWGPTLPPRGSEKGDVFLVSDPLVPTLNYWSGTAWVVIYAGPATPNPFVDLPDTPADYVGQGGYVLMVNGTEDGVFFADTSQIPVDNLATSTAFPTAPVVNQYVIVVDQGTPTDGLWVYDGTSWVQRQQF